jgi:hypothetical protein
MTDLEGGVEMRNPVVGGAQGVAPSAVLFAEPIPTVDLDVMVRWAFYPGIKPVDIGKSLGPRSLGSKLAVLAYLSKVSLPYDYLGFGSKRPILATRLCAKRLATLLTGWHTAWYHACPPL